MSDTSRRKFLAATGAGVAGAAAVGMTSSAASAVTARDKGAATEPVVAHVADPRTGVLTLMVGERQIVVEDHELVTRILNAAGRATGGE